MTRTLPLIAAALISSATLAVAVPAGAHADSDLVAVPAGGAAVVQLKPTHGCGNSPTTEVAIQVPVSGATPGEVPGWTASVTESGADRTVVEWTGGSLPVDQTGAFPVAFTAPDSAGELLLFPSVQVCANGEELSWIGGDPAGEYPAPRLLVLPAGTPAATSIDQVPADAPGRSQIAEVVAVPPGTEASTTTDPAETDQSTTSSPDAVPDTTAAAGADPKPLDATETSDGSGTGVIIGSVVVLAGAAALGAWALRRRRGQADPDSAS